MLMNTSELGYVSCHKAAKMIGVSHDTMRKLPIERLEIKTVGKRNTIRRFKESDVLAYIRQNTLNPENAHKPV